MSDDAADRPRGARVLNSDSVMCMSLSGRPSNIGTRFHNYLYEELDLDFFYKAFTTADIVGAVAGIRALGIRGCSISMPFKEDVIELVDEMTASADAIRSVNTIVNVDGHLTAYNTDYLAVGSLLRSHAIEPTPEVAVIGSGGMARAVVAALVGEGFTGGTVVARNEEAGTALAEQYGYGWQPVMGWLRPRLLVNATPIGMADGPEADSLPVDEAVVEAAETVFEVVAVPEQTPLVALAERLDKTVIRGTEVIALQAAEQFYLYTGVRPTDEQVARASAYSRS
jgi:shikimate dehydrogenase